MKIYEQKDDEAFVLSGDFDIAIPFSFAIYSDSTEPQIKVFPSLRPLAEEFAAKFGGALFSDAAVAWVKEKFGAYLTEKGFEIGEESDDYFVNYRLENAGGSIRTDTRQVGEAGALENLTGYDIDALEQFGHLCFATVMDGKIVSAACTNSPVFDDTEGDDIEIGVETAPGYEGRGFGRSNVAALSAALRARGCTALYECASKNTASMKLVQALGGREYARNYYIVGIRTDVQENE